LIINHFISPINFSNSIYLTYQGGQPFASFGSKTLVSQVTSVCLPSAPPEDNQPRGLVTEFLSITPRSGIGKRWWARRVDIGPTDKRKNLHRLDSRSVYAVPELDCPLRRWNTATVSFEGKPVPMLWEERHYEHNPHATNFARQDDTVLPGYFWKPSIKVGGVAYLVLRQMWKPVVDVNTRKYRLASDFEREVRPLIKGWWHAIKINNGWRLYAEDKDELFDAKLRIRT
jgi:hypothetical protein